MRYKSKVKEALGIRKKMNPSSTDNVWNDIISTHKGVHREIKKNWNMDLVLVASSDIQIM